MRVGILAVQGAFIEHEKILQKLGVPYIELRKKEDMEAGYDALILPGGESTVQSKLLHDLGMFEHIQKQITEGMPVLATCAGLILLAEHISNQQEEYFKTLPVTVKRNAYGRQLGSFYTEEEMAGIGKIPMPFIRAPYIETAGKEVEVLARVDSNIVAVKYQNQMALSFHPELTDDVRIHKSFLTLVSL